MATMEIMRPATSSSSPSCSNIEKEVKKLRRRMERIQALLTDAEEREIQENQIKLWLDELRDVAYDAEDEVEEFEYELLRYQLVCDDEETDQITSEKSGIKSENQVRDDSHITPPCPALHDPLFQQQVVAKIKEINNRFDEICNDKCALELGKNDPLFQQQDVERRPPTSSLLGMSRVYYGRDADKDDVVEMLLSSQFHEHGAAENVSVVSIVGMGGVGKTTLAQLVYNDDRVHEHFKLRLWVCVSDSFDVVRLTKEILEAATGQTIDLQGFDPLHKKLQDNLKGKKFLLVLDDLWNENYEQWEALCRPLSSGAVGSKVLVTTRNEKVSRISGATKMHRLKGLSEDDCWSLFAGYAFKGKNPKLLESIGRGIVQKCGGLPLAVKTVGSLLFNETDEDRWNDILQSDIWELPEEKNGILPALKLSYRHLPSPIKPCFAFCAVFPKDYNFRREELVLYWMAQGYIRPGVKTSMEDVGRKYFDDLLQRSFFQQQIYKFSRDEEPHYSMHDMIHDLALSISGGECSTVEGGKLPSTSRNARHLSFKCTTDIETLLSNESTDKLQYLRTCHCEIAYDLFSYWKVKVSDGMFRSMKCLRVLNLCGMRISKLPDSIGNLKHLRYLGIRVRELPESICNLLNLQTLEVEPYYFVGKLELPRRLKDLVKLRHLKVKYVTDIFPPPSMMPCGIGRLTQLQTLPIFVVSREICAASIGELRDLNDLQGKLQIHIRSLNNFVIGEPKILDKKKGLEVLDLNLEDLEETCDNGSSQSRQQQHEALLELIQPHNNIKEVQIRGSERSFYYGNSLPKWMGDPSYSRLETIMLQGCKNCRYLPALGQLPSLKSLCVENMNALKSVGHEFLGDGASPFPELEQLFFNTLPELEDLSCFGTEDGRAFPNLCHLSIQNCDELGYLKLRHLTALRKLYICSCNELTTVDFYHVASTEIRQEVIHHMHIPRVHTMKLECCPKLNFPQALSQQQLPLSLRTFWVAGSPLLGEWVEMHKHMFLGVPSLRPNDLPRRHLVLHNVEDVEEAIAARMKEGTEKLELKAARMNKGTGKLELRWDREWHRFSSRLEEAEQVLENLRPQNYCSLTQLVIEGYQGRSFPHWVGDPHNLPMLVKMTLSGCAHCERLPPLGRLPLLQELHISDMRVVEHVGREFGGEQQWRPGDGTFPKLHTLTICKCPKLRTILLPAIPGSCSSNTLSLDPLPRLKDFVIEDCPELVSLDGMHEIRSLQILYLVHCPALDQAQLPPEVRRRVMPRMAP